MPTSRSEATRPRSRAVPLVGSTIRLRIFSSVDFPAPLRPTMPTTSPRLTSKETSLSAQNPWSYLGPLVPFPLDEIADGLELVGDGLAKRWVGAEAQPSASMHTQVVILAHSIADDDGSAHDGRSNPRSQVESAKAAGTWPP